MPIYDNFKRDDWGYPIGGDKQPTEGDATEVNTRQDVNGSDNKPFPQERNFVINPDPSIGNLFPAFPGK